MATDNFNRADENPLAGNWTTSPGFAALRLVSNTCAGPSSAADAAAYWNAASFANDQYSQVVASTLGTNSDWGPAARCATGGGTRNCYVANTHVSDEQLFKFVGGSYSKITSVTTSNVIVGDTIRVEAQGTTIRWVKNGTTQGSATDSSLASGAAGIFVYEADPRLDNWEGGNIGSTPVNLVIQDGAHAHAADNLALTQLHVLSINEATHGHTAENLTLSVLYQLLIDEALHAHTVDNVDLTQLHILAIADALHSHLAENLGLTQQHLLMIAEVLHAHIAENLDLTRQHVLTVQDSTHAHTADQLMLQVTHVLAIDNAGHVHTADNLVLTQQHVLVIDDALHTMISDIVTMPTIEVETPLDRIFTIARDGRVYVILREDRTYAVPYDRRTFVVN